MSLDATSFAPAFKELYTPNEIQELVLKNRPLLAVIPKKENFYGEWAKQPTLYGNPQNVSATFSTAKAETSTSSLKAFLVTRVAKYGFATIDNQTLRASMNDAGAFEQAARMEIDGILNAVSNSLAVELFRQGWGHIGTISSINGTTITLTMATDAFNFEVGMKIVFATTLASSGLNSATAVTVTTVDRSSGLIGISATTGSPAATNFIFRAGDRQDSATPSRISYTGLEGWVPFTSPSSGESFFSVDRSVDSRLYGNHFDGTAVPIEEALISGITIAAQNGGVPDYVCVNHQQYANLCKALGSKVQYVDVGVEDANVMFRGIQVQAPSGAVTVLSDQYCPGNRAYVIESESMLLHTIGAPVSIFDTDGNVELREADADAVTVRITSYGQLRVLQPSHFCTISLPIPS